jgi:hypothetical protein
MGDVNLDLPLQGQVITRISFDYRLVILAEDGGEISIECDFTLNHHGKAPVYVKPAKPTESAAIIVDLLHKKIDSAAAVEDGSLRLHINECIEIVVSPHQDYEAWNFAFGSNYKVVSLPGGGLSTWS